MSSSLRHKVNGDVPSDICQALPRVQRAQSLAPRDDEDAMEHVIVPHCAHRRRLHTLNLNAALHHRGGPGGKPSPRHGMSLK